MRTPGKCILQARIFIRTRILHSRSGVIFNFINFSARAFSKVMTWLSFMDFRSSLAAKIKKNVSLTLLYSKMACFLDIYPAFSAEEQCFSKAERIQA